MLVCRAGDRLCALPLEHVRETLRPMPLVPFDGAPSFVSGVALIRGRPTPVIDLRQLLGSGSGSGPPPARLVTLVLPADGHRPAALALDAVLGVRDVAAAHLDACPKLLHEQLEVVSALGRLDQELLLVLDHARLLTASSWEQPERERAST